MSMRIIYGKQIGALRDRILDEIVQADHSERRLYLVAPASRTLLLERRYLERTPAGTLMRAEVLNMSRLLLRIWELLGKSLSPQLSDQGQALLLRRLFQEEERQYPVLAPLLRKAGYQSVILEDLASLRQAGLTAASLESLAADYAAEEAASGVQGLFSYLQQKWLELARLLRRMEELGLSMGRRWQIQDEEVLADFLEDLQRRRLQGAELSATEEELLRHLASSRFYFWGQMELRELSCQAERVLRGLDQLGAELVLAIPCDFWAEQRQVQEQGALLWQPARRVLASFLRRHPTAEVERLETSTALAEVLEAVYPPAETGQRGGPAPAAAPDLLIQGRAKSQEELYTQLAAYIRQRCRQDQLRYSDFVICLGSLSYDQGRLLQCLEEAGIGAYLNERYSLQQSHLYQELLAYFALQQSGWKRPDLTRYLHYRFGAERTELWAETQAFLRYCRALDLEGWRLHRHFSRSSTAEQELCKEDPPESPPYMHTQGMARAYYRRYLAPLYERRPRGQGQLSSGAFTDFIGEYEKCTELERRCRQRCKAASEAGRSEESRREVGAWNSLLGFLQDLQDLLGPEQQLPLGDYLDLLRQAATASRRGSLPNRIDQVYLARPDACLATEPQELIILGLPEGGFFDEPEQPSLLGELDCHYLDRALEEGRRLRPGTQDGPYAESFKFYQLLSQVRGRLSLFIEEQSRDKLPPIWAKLAERLPAARYSWTQPYPEYWEQERCRRQVWAQQTSAPGPIPLEGLERLDGFPGVQIDNTEYRKLIPEKLSISQLDVYAQCPYSYWMKYILGLEESQDVNIEAARMGSLRHLLVEQLMAPLQINLGDDELSALKQDQSVKLQLSKVHEAYQKKITELAASEAAFCQASQPEQLWELLQKALEELPAAERFLERGRFGPYIRELICLFEDQRQALLEDLRQKDKEAGEQIFLPVFNEWDFQLQLPCPNENKNCTEAERSVQIQGRIDRVDLMAGEGELGYRVLDYKSSPHSIDYAALQAGLSHQLGVYLLAVAQTFARAAEKSADKDAHWPVRPLSARYYTLGPQRGYLRGEDLPESSVQRLARASEQTLNLEPDEMRAFLRAQGQVSQEQGQALREGRFPLRPRATAAHSPCMFCVGQEACPLRSPRRHLAFQRSKKADFTEWLRTQAQEMKRQMEAKHD